VFELGPNYPNMKNVGLIRELLLAGMETIRQKQPGLKRAA